MKRCLDLDESAELRVVVLDVEATVLISLDVGVQPADRDVMDAHVGVVSSPQPDLIVIIEIYYVQLLLLFMFDLW